MSSAPMYPTDVVSNTAIREKANQSADDNKLHALFAQVLQSETGLLAKTYIGQFHFVVNAVKGVTREFMQALHQDKNSNKSENSLLRNARNVQLEVKRDNLKSVLAGFEKEENGWIVAKQNIQYRRQQHGYQESTALATVDCATFDTAEIDNVQDIVTKSVHGIAIQVRDVWMLFRLCVGLHHVVYSTPIQSCHEF